MNKVLHFPATHIEKIKRQLELFEKTRQPAVLETVMGTTVAISLICNETHFEAISDMGKLFALQYGHVYNVRSRRDLSGLVVPFKKRA